MRDLKSSLKKEFTVNLWEYEGARNQTLFFSKNINNKKYHIIIPYMKRCANIIDDAIRVLSKLYKPCKDRDIVQKEVCMIIKKACV